MYAILNYTNTKCEIEMGKTRLNLLLDRKEKLYSKYFPITSQLKSDIVDGGEKKDPMPDYLNELHQVDLGTGMSLEQEIEYERSNINKLQRYLNSMNTTLSKMTGIEYQLFYEIVYTGLTITKAVEKVAETNEKDSQTIWKNYYRKIKKDVKKIAKYSESTVKSIV